MKNPNMTNLQIIEKLEAAAILEAFKRNGGRITARELSQVTRTFRGTGGTDRAEKKLREMIAAGRLSTISEQGERGRPKEVFQLS